ncbi:MAG: hypothetical protein JSW27_24520 [Phycisphaerales bacterium]|nr:MAG: hypothetical protein JSW27_24520 [Phycisphaerales bacterium]
MKTNARRQMGPMVAVVVLGWIAALEPAVGLGQAQEPNKPDDPWGKYELILERNMFSRQRGPRRREDRGERREVAMPNPESYFRLRGIVQEDGRFIAFVEDTRSNSVLKLRQGDSVARGTVKALTLDTVEYQLGDQVTTVRLGYDLEGGQGAVTMNELMEWPQTTATPAAPSEASSSETPTGEAADILKQLMERRRRELGQ